MLMTRTSSGPNLSFIFLTCFSLVVARAHDITPITRYRRSSSYPLGFANPSNGGGSWLTQVPGTFPAGQGEPINAIISANSDAAVRKDQNMAGGLQNYFNSIGYSTECLGQHEGDAQAANLGDGHGYLNQTAEIRWDYGDAQLGTCEETIQGGSHFRYWTQNGPSADSGAIFLAVSYELPLKDEHDIIFDGYNLGRDWFIGNVTNQTSIIQTASITNGTTYSGSTSFSNFTYLTNVQYLFGFGPNTSYGVNHNLTTGNATINSADGYVAVLTVTITGRPASSALYSRTVPPLSYLLITLIPIAFTSLLL